MTVRGVQTCLGSVAENVDADPLVLFLNIYITTTTLKIICIKFCDHHRDDTI